VGPELEEELERCDIEEPEHFVVDERTIVDVERVVGSLLEDEHS
jgi:hypothetical protein